VTPDELCPSAPDGDLRSYGRRRGRKPSARQAALWSEALPRRAVDPGSMPPSRIADLFPVPVTEVWLEIGFGGGEHLVWQASHRPAVGLIGCEPFEDGVVKALAAAEERGLANLRLHAGDARPLLRWLPEASLGRAFVLFPDPWPKKKHRKRRLIARPFLDLLARVLRPGAELRLATDIADYADEMREAGGSHTAFRLRSETGGGPEERGPDWPVTRYEEKARAAGRPARFFRFERL